MREFVVCNGLAIKSDNTKNKIMNRYVFSLLVFLLLSIITSFITNNSFIDKIYPILGIILTLGICYIVEYVSLKIPPSLVNILLQCRQYLYILEIFPMYK